LVDLQEGGLDVVTKATSKAVRVVNVRFENAAAVFLVGKFNNWSTRATPLVYLGNRV
jgi:hypothetical protein